MQCRDACLRSTMWKNVISTSVFKVEVGDENRFGSWPNVLDLPWFFHLFCIDCRITLSTMKTIVLYDENNCTEFTLIDWSLNCLDCYFIWFTFITLFTLIAQLLDWLSFDYVYNFLWPQEFGDASQVESWPCTSRTMCVRKCASGCQNAQYISVSIFVPGPCENREEKVQVYNQQEESQKFCGAS